MKPAHDAPLGKLRTLLRGAVQANPGIHFRALARAVNITSVGQLRHHIDRLEHQGILIEVQDGGYKRFFVAGQQEPQLRPKLARFSRRIARQIAHLLLAGPLARTELRERLGCADSTLGFHLTRMLAQGDLDKHRDGNHSRYELKDPDLVRRVLFIQDHAPPQDPSEMPAIHGMAPVPPVPADPDPELFPTRLPFTPPDQDFLAAPEAVPGEPEASIAADEPAPADAQPPAPPAASADSNASDESTSSQ